jgi:hypothetical protein
MPRKGPGPDGDDQEKPSKTSVSFHFGGTFLPYVARLEEYAAARNITLGPAARELVQKALDAAESPPRQQPRAAAGPEVSAEIAGVQQSVRALEIALGMGLEEHRERLDRLSRSLDSLLQFARDVEAFIRGSREGSDRA